MSMFLQTAVSGAVVGWSHRYIPSSDMFFSDLGKTVPNQLKIGDDRDPTNTKKFTEAIITILSISAILELIPEPTWPRLGAKIAEEEAKKAENPGKRSVATWGACGCLGVTAWQGSGSCATAEAAVGT